MLKILMFRHPNLLMVKDGRQNKLKLWERCEAWLRENILFLPHVSPELNIDICQKVEDHLVKLLKNVEKIFPISNYSTSPSSIPNLEGYVRIVICEV